MKWQFRKKITKKQAEHFMKVHREAKKVYKNGNYLEAVVLQSQLIDEILLRFLFLFTAGSVGIRGEFIEYVLETPSALKFAFSYLLLSHDEELFTKFKKYNSRRNVLIHDLTKRADIDYSEYSKKTYEYGRELTRGVAERLLGKKEIPVLTLKKRGIEEFINYLEKLIEETESGE